jgi:hypothetical protein
MRWGTQRTPLLLHGAFDSMTTPRAELPIAFLGCCSTGWYDREDGSPSLSESMLFAEGGPIAVIAGSRPTHPYATAVLQADIARLLLHERVETIGELDLRATRSMLERDSTDASIDMIAKPIAALMNWPCSLDELRLMHVRMYNLLGDPSTRIAHPPAPPESIELLPGRVAVTVAQALRGEVTLTLETGRDACATGPLRAAARADDPDLETISGANYPRCNERVLWTGVTEITGPRIEAVLPDPLPTGAALLRIEVRGVDSGGAAIARLGGVLIPAATPSPLPSRP